MRDCLFCARKSESAIGAATSQSSPYRYTPAEKSEVYTDTAEEGEVYTDTAEDGPLAGLAEAVPGGRRVLPPPAHLTLTPTI